MTDKAKRLAAAAALELVEDGMTLGLGTGSTANFFLEGLGEKIRAGMTVRGVPTSKASEALALKHGVEIITPDETTVIDLDIDGADEITPDGAIIKGGGGALLREKIVAAASKSFVVIADASKRVETLGRFPLPVEVEPFAFSLTITAIRAVLREQGLSAAGLTLRTPQGGSGAFLTDGGNYVVDLALERITDPEPLDQALTLLPGVVTTGLFLGLNPQALLANDQGIVAT
ncbi:MAG: ribose-5-phosphate isomerase RpiA [Pseudomonadota bacterium]